jgi:hypothetical protein
MQNIWIDFGGDVGGVDVFCELGNMKYKDLAQNAKKINTYLLASLEDVKTMKEAVLKSQSAPNDQKRKARKDIALIEQNALEKSMFQ